MIDLRILRWELILGYLVVSDIIRGVLIRRRQRIRGTEGDVTNGRVEDAMLLALKRRGGAVSQGMQGMQLWVLQKAGKQIFSWSLYRVSPNL